MDIFEYVVCGALTQTINVTMEKTRLSLKAFIRWKKKSLILAENLLCEMILSQLSIFFKCHANTSTLSEKDTIFSGAMLKLFLFDVAGSDGNCLRTFQRAQCSRQALRQLI